MKKVNEKDQKSSPVSINNSKKMNLKDQTIIGIDNETEIDFVIISGRKFFHVNLQKKTDHLTFLPLKRDSFMNWLAD
jgi:hypothetical protein